MSEKSKCLIIKKFRNLCLENKMTLKKRQWFVSVALKFKQPTIATKNDELRHIFCYF